jgi:hypothetical protein
LELKQYRRQAKSVHLARDTEVRNYMQQNMMQVRDEIQKGKPELLGDNTPAST